MLMNRKAKKPSRVLVARRASPRSAGAAEVRLGDLRDLVGYAIRRAQIAVFRHFRKSFALYKIRPIHYGVLAVVEATPGLKQSEVCTALGIKRANFVGILDELEQRDLIARRSAEDQRANALYLTRPGKSLMAKLRQLNRTHEGTIAAELTYKERVKLIEMLNRIIRAAYSDL